MPDAIAEAYANLIAAQNAMLVAVERLRGVLASAAGVGEGGQIQVVQAMVARRYGFSVEQFRSRDRTAELAHARQIAMWLCRQHTKASLQDVGRAFDRDHGTVMHAIRAVGDRAGTEPRFATELMDLSARIAAAMEGKS